MTRRRKGWLLASLAAVPLLILGGWASMSENTSERPYAGQEQPVTVAVGDSMAAYFDRNALEDRERFYEDDARDFGSDFVVARANQPDDPAAIVLNYGHDGCPFEVPPGRMLALGYNAGTISSLTFLFPGDPLPWDELGPAVDDVIARLNDAGWQMTEMRAPLAPEDFLDKGAKKWARVGRWTPCDGADVRLTLTVDHYNSKARGTFTPPAVLSEEVPEDAPDTFLFKLFVTSEGGPGPDELTILRDARREAVHGDPKKPIPLRYWLEDPDWRPE